MLGRTMVTIYNKNTVDHVFFIMDFKWLITAADHLTKLADGKSTGNPSYKL